MFPGSRGPDPIARAELIRGGDAIWRSIHVLGQVPRPGPATAVLHGFGSEGKDVPSAADRPA